MTIRPMRKLTQAVGQQKGLSHFLFYGCRSFFCQSSLRYMTHTNDYQGDVEALKSPLQSNLMAKYVMGYLARVSQGGKRAVHEAVTQQV